MYIFDSLGTSQLGLDCLLSWLAKGQEWSEKRVCSLSTIPAMVHWWVHKSTLAKVCYGCCCTQPTPSPNKPHWNKSS